MKLILDPHTVIWWVDQHGFLSPAAHAAIANPNNEQIAIISNDAIFDRYSVSRIW